MSSYLRSSIRTALIAAAVAGSGVAAAAEPQQTTFIEEIEVVVTTGSYIEGAAEDAALPIDVLRSEDLAKQGSPNMVDLIRSIPAMQGTVGESNQFTAGGTSGTAGVNLRGLGAPRTLILLNGRRLSPSAASLIGYDANMLPVASIGRIEVLKDGAAATYGSDAVAGVVNFITKKLDGFEVEGSYNYIDGSDGDYTASMAFGHKGETSDMLISAGYRHRSELSALDRDFSVRPFAQNPQGGFSGFGNPGTFILPGGAGAAASFVDPGCDDLGQIQSATGCQFQFTQFDNIVEEEEQYNVYAEYNKLFGESLEWHVEAFYAAHDVPEENSSPSYAPTQNATLSAAGVPGGPTFSISANHPGLTAAYIAGLSAAQQAQLATLRAANGNIAVSGLQWRPFGIGGNPLTGGEGKEDSRFFDGFRFSTGLKGEFAETNWDVAVTYMENTRELRTPDIIVTRLASALRGLGGPNCTGTTPGANGCLYFNPFSTAVQRNAITGQVNPFFDPNQANSVQLADYLFEDSGSDDTAKTFVVDAVLTGQLPFGFSAGSIGWAAGAQFREETLERDPFGFSDISQFPCVTSLTNPAATCSVQSGVFSFQGPVTPLDLSRDVKAVFSELNIPVLENLSAQLAVRYEDYGDSVGATTNPKFSFRYSPFDFFALRGSVGTTFRGPLQTQLDPSSTAGLAFTPAATGYKTYDTFGNQNLKAEEAFTFNVGFIVKAGGFAGTLDYWSYDLEDALENESGTEIVAKFFGTAPGAANQCNNPAFAVLRQRFTFGGGDGSCSIANLTRVRTQTINGPDQKISGFDASLQYSFENVLKGDIVVGSDATYTLEYERDAAVVDGVEIQAAMDFIGTRGASGILAATLPELRGSAYFDYSTDWLAAQGVRITARYVKGVQDVRAGLGTATANGVNIDDFVTYDLVYRLSLPAQTTLTASVINFTDEDPPLVRLDLGYDPFIANPLGRYFKLLVNKRF
ncbi:MAG: TonB-dependent receptor [Steroidobacter sp.]